MLLNKEKTIECINRITKGCPQEIVLRDIGLLHNRNSIRLSAKKYNIPFKLVRNTFIIKGDYFDYINSDNQSYILGLLYADGCITKSKHTNEKLNLVLKDEDLDTVKWVLKELKPEGKVYFIKSKNQVGFFITLPYLTDRLKDLGVIPNKSIITDLLVPNFIFNNRTLFFSFLRGFFDGDGSIFKTCNITYQRYGFNLSSTNSELLTKIKSYIDFYFKEEFNFVGKSSIRKDIYSKFRKHDLFQYIITDPLLILWIGNNMYLNPSHFMKRKYERFVDFAVNLININTNINNYYLVKLEAQKYLITQK